MDRRIAQEIRSQWRSILMLVLVVWFLFSNAFRSALAPTPGITGIDFQIYYDAANRLAHGQSLYIFRPAGDTYVYSPFLAFLLRPLAGLDYQTALMMWFCIMAACLGTSVLLYTLSARLTWRDLVVVCITLIIGFRFWPSTMNFSLGQVNFLILLLISGIYLADSLSKPRWIVGLIVGAALIKTWMLGLLLYLALRRRWREAFAGVLVYALLLAASFSAVGWREWPTFWRLTAGYANQSIGQIAATQSFSGFAYLHFGQNSHVQPLMESPWMFQGVVLGGIALMLFGFSKIWSGPAPVQPSYRAKLELGLVILSLLLLLPMCQNEYFVFCLPLLWALIAPVPSAPGEQSPGVPAILGGFLIYVIFTRSWPEIHPASEEYQHGLRSLLISMNFFAAVMLWFITLRALRHIEIPNPRKPGKPQPVR